MDQTLHMWLHRRTYKPSMPLFLPLLYKDELLLYTKRSYQLFLHNIKNQCIQSYIHPVASTSFQCSLYSTESHFPHGLIRPDWCRHIGTFLPILSHNSIVLENISIGTSCPYLIHNLNPISCREHIKLFWLLLYIRSISFATVSSRD